MAGNDQPTAAARPEPLLRLAAFFEALTPQSLDDIDRIYTETAQFKDPFNEVQGLAAIRRVFDHMFATTEAPRFVVRTALGDARQGFLTWDFHFRSKGRGARTWVIHGASRVEFGPDGRVLLHRDYWDAAGELYEKLPLIGAVLRALRCRLRV